VCAQYLATIESILNGVVRGAAHSERECPLRRFKVLRLYRAEPTHYIDSFAKVRRRQSLIV
jgi:hypothetical protein